MVKWPRDELLTAAPTVATIALVFSMLLYGACFAAAPPVAGLLGAPAAVPMIRVPCLAIVFDALATVPASKIAVSETGFGELCGLDGVEADGVAQTVGVAGDAS